MLSFTLVYGVFWTLEAERACVSFISKKKVFVNLLFGFPFLYVIFFLWKRQHELFVD